MAELSAYHRFELTDLPVSAWKNGGGTTTELACWPRGADLSTFDARVSIASVTRSGPFSAFDGIDRTIMLVDGAGLRLQSRDAGIDHALTTPWAPFSFRGDVAIGCDLLGDASRDFNVMVRRNAWRADVRVLREHAAITPSPMGLLFAASGVWEAANDRVSLTLPPESGIRWDHEALPLNLRPVHEPARTGTPTHLLVAVLLR